MHCTAIVLRSEARQTTAECRPKPKLGDQVPTLPLFLFFLLSLHLSPKMAPAETDSLLPPLGRTLSSTSSRVGSSLRRRRPSFLLLSDDARLERREKRIRRLMLGEWSTCCCSTAPRSTLLTCVIYP